MRHLSNDNAVSCDRRLPEPDAHGRASMLLIESLIHALIARSILSVADAAEAVEVAVDVAEEMEADAVGALDAPSNLWKSVSILGAIHKSLAHDLPR